MTVERACALPDAGATEHLGAAMATAAGRLVVYLHGDLGAGKTTLVRGLLRALGHVGPVPSPTYTLLEPYELPGRRCLHLDLYRLADPEELDYLGLREWLDDDVLVLIEWPERGSGTLPGPDMEVWLSYCGRGREARLSAVTAAGERLLECVPADENE